MCAASVQVCGSHSWLTPTHAPSSSMSFLSKQAQTAAKEELQEDDTVRDEALKEFRDWIQRNDGIVNCRLDDSFLLRFLRIRKWSVALAEHNLVKYLNFRQSVSHYTFNMDPEDEKVARLIHAGYLFPSPVRDSLGRRVIIGIASKLDLSKYSNITMGKVHAITYEALLEDEENQVLGFQHFGDLKGVHMAHISLFSPVEFAMCMRIGEQAFPMRHKGVHFINMNPAFKYVYDFFSSRFSEKMRERLMVHNSIEALHEHMERQCLPKEYGGDIPMSDMIVSWQKELAGRRQALLDMDKMRSHIPIQRRNDKKVEELRGSFKKLEVD